MCKESMCDFLERTQGEVWLLAIPLMSDQDEPGGKGALTWNLVSFFSKYKILYFALAGVAPVAERHPGH